MEQQTCLLLSPFLDLPPGMSVIWSYNLKETLLSPGCFWPECPITAIEKKREHPSPQQAADRTLTLICPSQISRASCSAMTTKAVRDTSASLVFRNPPCEEEQKSLYASLPGCQVP